MVVERLRTLAVLLAIVVGLVGIVMAGHRGWLTVPGVKGPQAPGVQTVAGGPIYSEPGQFVNQLIRDSWIDKLPLGQTTFGQTIPQQVRFTFDGQGAPAQWATTAETKPAAALVQGASEARTATFLHGLLQQMAERHGYIRNFSLSTSQTGFEANTIVIFIQNGLFDDAENESQLTQALMAALNEAYSTTDAYAWFQFESSQIVLGPEMSKELVDFLHRPSALTPKRGLFLAYIVRHELEHSVTPANDDGGQLRWLEEGSVDTLARWPGQAAHTAQLLGLPAPKDASAYPVDHYFRHVSGYDAWVTKIRALLGLAGIDTSDPKAFAAASSILQSKVVSTVPETLAQRIAERHHLSASQTRTIGADIEELGNHPALLAAIEHIASPAVHKK